MAQLKLKLIFLQILDSYGTRSDSGHLVGNVLLVRNKMRIISY